jgi:hypothetical protein
MCVFRLLLNTPISRPQSTDADEVSASRVISEHKSAAEG